MRSRPQGLPDGAVADAVRAGWDVAEPLVLEHRPVGFGSHHWQVTAGDGTAWFCTVDDLTARLRTADDSADGRFRRLRAALDTATAARDAGAGFAVTPIRSRDGAVVRRLDRRYAVALYPYLDGRCYLYDGPLPEAGRHAVLDMLVTLHGLPGEVRRAAEIEDFQLVQRDGLMDALAELGTRWESGPYAEPLRALLQRHAGTLRTLLDDYDRLVADAMRQPDRMVLTHGEPHPGNLLETRDGWVLLDWDTALVAPPERDVWMAAEADPAITGAYVARTGRALLPWMIELYRLGWRLADIAQFVDVLHRPHRDDPDTQLMWRSLTHLDGAE